VALGGGAVPAGSKRRESAEDARLDSRKLPAGSILLRSCPKRRIGGGHGVGGALVAMRGSVGAGDGGSGARRLEQELGHTAHDLLVL
jgi:hypothetical protein